MYDQKERGAPPVTVMEDASRSHDADRVPGRRFESKYLVDENRAQRIRDYIRPFMELDRFAAARNLHKYPVCSLYLDSSDLELCRKTLHGHKNRYKLRVRTYSDDPDDPLFFEVKRRVDGMVIKARAQISRAQGDAILAGRIPRADQFTPDLFARINEFSALSQTTRAKPVLRVKYQREAYESTGPNHVRITFDTQLRHAVTPLYEVSHDGPGWCATPVPGTILEIKFNQSFPSWITSLIQTFDLQKLSVAKYCLSMTRAIDDGRYHHQMAARLRSH